jgi:hypothetical protein
MGSQEEGCQKENKTESISQDCDETNGVGHRGAGAQPGPLAHLTEYTGAARAKREVGLVSKAPRQVR